MLNKRGFNPNVLLQLVMFVVMIGVFLSIGSLIISDIRVDMTAETEEYNVTSNALEGLQDASSWLPIVGLIVGVVIIIFVVALLRNSY